MLKRRLISFLIVFILIPAVVLIGYFLIRGKQYYLVCALICLISLVPFFMSLERKRLQARELVTLSSIIALAVASRAAFFFLEQAKPTCAIIILAAVVFGPEFGFASGALAMLLSNMIFGQGMWTPFQMVGMGLTAYICGLIFHRERFKSSIISLGIVSGVLCFLVYGFVVDTGSVFMLASSLTLENIMLVYASGIPFNLIHSATTAILIIFLGKTVTEKLERVKIKYDMFGELK